MKIEQGLISIIVVEKTSELNKTVFDLPDE